MSAARAQTNSAIRARDERARAAYYAHYRCRRCGECPSIFHDEYAPDGPLCTPCRAAVSAEASGGAHG